MKKPVILCIMDGFGISDEIRGNAVRAARTPELDAIFSSCPHTLLGASGGDVGLPDGQMGNSEVGHTNIGAGRIVYQELTKITKAVEDKSFFENEAFDEAIKNCIQNNSALHLAGLLSDGGVHSHISHLFALLELAKKRGLEKVYVHAILDGRDVPPTSGVDFIRELCLKLKELGTGRLATITGRFYAMDRDNRWERVEKAYRALVNAEGEYCAEPVEAVLNSYAKIDSDSKHLTDEFMLPTVIDRDGRVRDGDSFIFFNFRPDRARELTRAFTDTDFKGFEREPLSLCYVCMTEYDSEIRNVRVAFGPEKLENTLGEYLSSKGLTQLRIAETEKYAHVTFFFNGGVEAQSKGEERILVPSPKISTYDLKPEMSAPEVSDRLNAAVRSKKYDFIAVNFANCDMVGHTGVFDAAVKAVEAVDKAIGSLRKAVLEAGGVILLTADHGNADKMLDDDGKPFTAHTTAPVPLALIGCRKEVGLRGGGRLCDLAPTVLELLGLPVPPEMTGKTLLKRQ